MQLSERLRTLREQNGLTQNQIAESLGISINTYVKYERGEREPRYNTLIALAEYFNVTIDYLLGKSDEKDRNVDLIKRFHNFLMRDEIPLIYGNDSENVQKMITDYIAVIYSLQMPQYLDVFYPLVCISEQMIKLYSECSILYGYEPMTGELQDTANGQDQSKLAEAMAVAQQLRTTLDEFISMATSQEHHARVGSYHYEKNIHEYSKNSKVQNVKAVDDLPFYRPI